MKTTSQTVDLQSKKPLWHSVVSYLIIFVGQLFVYLPVLTNKFLLPDDYDYFWAGIIHSDRFTVQAIAQDRLFNMLVAPSFAWIGKIDDMWIIRLIGLLGIFVLALCIFHTFKRYGENIFLSALFALLITIMPAFQEFATWAVLYLASWAAVIAYVTFLCLEKAGTVKKLQRWLWAFFSVLLIIVAYNIHPTSTTFIAVFITIFFLYDRSEKRLPKTFFFLVMSGIGAIANYIVFKLYLILLNTPALERASLITDPLEKLSWFVTRPLYKSINLIYLPANMWVALAVLFIILSGLGIYFFQKGHKKDIAINIIFLFLLVLLSYSSNLIIDENLANYRTLLALTGVLAAMTFKGLQGYFYLFKNPQTQKWISYCVIGTLTVFSVIFVRFLSYTELLMNPISLTLQEFRSSLEHFNAEKYQRIVLTYQNDTEHQQAFAYTYYPTVIHSILFDKTQHLDNTPVTVRASDYAALDTDYIIPIEHITPVRKLTTEE